MYKKFNYQEKYKILAFMYRHGDIFDTCDHFKIKKEQLVQLARTYENGGIEAIKGKKYIAQHIKIDALRELTILKVPIRYVSSKYKIHSALLRYWLKGYNIDLTKQPKLKNGADTMRNSMLFTSGCHNATVLYEGKSPEAVHKQILNDNPEVLYRYTALQYLLKNQLKGRKLNKELLLEAIEESNKTIKKLKEKLPTGKVRGDLFKNADISIEDQELIYKADKLKVKANQKPLTDKEKAIIEQAEQALAKYKDIDSLLKLSPDNLKRLYKKYLQMDSSVLFNFSYEWHKQLHARWIEPTAELTRYDIEFFILKGYAGSEFIKKQMEK